GPTTQYASGKSSNSATSFGSEPAERVGHGDSITCTGDHDQREHNQSIDRGPGTLWRKHNEYIHTSLRWQAFYAGCHRTRAWIQPWPCRTDRNVAAGARAGQSHPQCSAYKHRRHSDPAGATDQPSGSAPPARPGDYRLAAA